MWEVGHHRDGCDWDECLEWADGMGLYIIFILISLVGGMAVSQCDECDLKE